MLTSEELQAIRERASKATPGPWFATADAMTGVGTAMIRPGSPHSCPTFRGYSDLERDMPDAAFIAASRADIPALLDAVTELRGLLRRIGIYLHLTNVCRYEDELFRAEIEEALR